jgi:imidazolonepropionase-like amidohydrolase
MKRFPSAAAALKGGATCAAVALVAVASAIGLAQAPGGAAVYEGARLIIGDARPPIENGAFVVQNGRITAVGRKGAVAVPAGVAHVDLTGKTVMPAMINAHVHIGYEGYSRSGAANYTPQNARPPAARGVLRRRRDAVGRQQPDRGGAAVSARSAGWQVRAGLALFHASEWRRTAALTMS